MQWLALLSAWVSTTPLTLAAAFVIGIPCIVMAGAGQFHRGERQPHIFAHAFFEAPANSSEPLRLRSSFNVSRVSRHEEGFRLSFERPCPGADYTVVVSGGSFTTVVGPRTQNDIIVSPVKANGAPDFFGTTVNVIAVANTR